MNRVVEYIAKIEENVGRCSVDQLDRLESSCMLECDEYIRFQELKSIHAGSLLSMDEAMTVYGILGESLNHFHSQRLSHRITCLKIFTELLEHSLKTMKG